VIRTSITIQKERVNFTCSKVIIKIETKVELLPPWTQEATEDFSSLYPPHAQLRTVFPREAKLYSISFDMENALIRVWKLICELPRTAGSTGPFPLLLQNFLYNRAFRVRIGNHLSVTYPQLNGIPQDPPLSEHSLHTCHKWSCLHYLSSFFFFIMVANFFVCCVLASIRNPAVSVSTYISFVLQ